MSHIEDDGWPSSEIIVTEEKGDTDNRLWVRVAPPYYGNEQAKYPVVWVTYQDDQLRGPVMIDEATWHRLRDAVEWRLQRHKPFWKQVLWRLSR